MRIPFPLFNTPIDLAHQFFEKILKDDDAVIDATCGNGKDSLALANFLKNKKNTALFCLDIQKEAIDKTQLLLKTEVPSFFSSIRFLLGSHESLPKVTPHKLKLIVYNLGYLPSGDKSLTTKTDSTLKSVLNALDTISLEGAISITCYPGHPEGKKEQEALLKLVSSLDPKTWNVTSFTWENRGDAPSLLLVQKCKKT